MKQTMTFEMVDPSHRSIDIDTTALEKVVMNFGKKAKPVTKKMELLSAAEALAGDEGGSSAITLAFIRAETKGLLEDTYVLNAFLTPEEEASSAYRMLMEVKALVEHIDAMWRYTEVIRRNGWSRDSATKSAFMLLSDLSNKHGRCAAAAQRKVATLKLGGRNLSDAISEITTDVVLDMKGWFPEEEEPEETEAVYNAVESVVVEPNYLEVLKTYVSTTVLADAHTGERILGLKDTANLEMFGVGPEYWESGSSEGNGDSNLAKNDPCGAGAAEYYQKAINAVKSIVDENACTGHKKLIALEDALILISELAANAAKKSPDTVDGDTVIRLLSFVIVRSGVTGLHGHKLFMGAFLEGSKRWLVCLTKLDRALEIIDGLTYDARCLGKSSRRKKKP